MKSIRLLDRRAGFSFSAIMLLLGLVVPSLVPVMASAGNLSGRSVQMSNSGPSAVAKYKVTIQPSADILSGGGFVIEFCSDSPIPGGACAGGPTGFTAANAVLGTVSTAGSITKTATSVKFTASATIPAASAGSYEFTTITNPSTTGTFYARIYTYANGTLGNYTALATPGTYQDGGGIALATAATVGVTAVVREQLQFCINATAPAAGCTSLTTPVSLTLGHGSPLALDSSAVDSSGAYSQISTNAASGAIVNMTTDNACGGLHRVGAAGGTCDIPAAGSGANTTGGFTIPITSTGGFGLSLGTPAGTGSSFGTVNALAPYNGGAAKYGFYTTGLTSTYGDTVYNTNNGPIANMNVPMTFAAAAATTTPAGTYTANMNLVATGTF